MSEEPEGLRSVHKLRRAALKVVAETTPPDESDSGQGEMTFLPEGCPVQPIGTNGDLCYYLDQLGQLREIKARDHSRLNLQQMFGRKKELLYEYWPRKKQDQRTGAWEITGWKPELCAETLMAECAKLGVWSAEERVRGAGAWSGAEGELILHCGDVLLMVPVDRSKLAGGAWLEHAPGLVGKLVYPTGPHGLRPHPESQAAGPAGPAGELLALLQTWNWRRPAIDAHLLLGWIGAAMLGGALDWRVVAWITGGKGTGKTTLQNVIKWLMGDHGLLHTSDGTAAAIRQVLKFASRPVALDEAESDEDNRKMQQLIKLARDAASGSITLRGGQDHQASAFTVRSCFLFSSILIPPLLGQDRSRIAVLELDKIEASGMAKSVQLTPKKIADLGERLLRRLISQWPRFAMTIETYRRAMADAGHSARGQDLFGTLLTCADLMLSDELPGPDALAGWQSKLRAGAMAEIEGDVPDEVACLGHLLSTALDHPRDRVRQTIGQWVMVAAGKSGEASSRMTIEELNACEAASRSAQKLLLDVGLKIELQDEKLYLAVANIHRGLSKIYESTHWSARPGAQGVWVQALLRLTGGVRSKKTIWFGSSSRATMVPLELCVAGKDDAAAVVLPPRADLLGDEPPERGEF